MKIILTSWLVFLFAFGTGAVAHAQGKEWETLNEETRSLYRQGRYDQAVVVAKKALRIAEQAVGPNHPSVATSVEIKTSRKALVRQKMFERMSGEEA
jgi:hypothetical protein